MKRLTAFFIFFANIILLANTFYMPGYPLYTPHNNFEQNPTENMYPDVNSSGFIEIKVSGRDYTDDLSKLDQIRKDNYYNKIPKNVIKGSPKLENRYSIELDGKLDKDTEVRYSIHKEPDFPGQYDVLIKRKTSSLQFGDFDTRYTNGDYVNVEKHLNGIEAKTIQDGWTATTTLGKEKSTPQLFESYGTGSRSYKLGKNFILESSVIVYLNNTKLSENSDYTVNYFKGTILFKKIISKTDFIKIIYEFTNPVQDFIPSLSRKNFTGANYVYNPSQGLPIDTFHIASKNETIVITSEKHILDNRIQLNYTPIELGSDSVYLNDKLLTKGIDYYLKNDSGVLRFSSVPLNFNDKIKISYRYFTTKFEHEKHIGKGDPGLFLLKHRYPLSSTLEVILNNSVAKEFIDYIYKPNSNTVEFLYNIPKFMPLDIRYQYKVYEEKELPFRQTPLSISVTYLGESTSIREDSLLRENYAIESISNNIVILKDTPLDESKSEFVSIKVGEDIIPKTDYSVDFYKGELVFPNTIQFNKTDVKVDYYYLNSHLVEHSFRAQSGLVDYTQDHIKFRSIPIRYQGISKITMFSDGVENILNSKDYSITYHNDNDKLITLKFNYPSYGGNLTHRPGNNDIIKIQYYHTPRISDTQSNSKHSLTDIRIKTKINNQWNIYSEIANTNYNYSKTSNYKKFESRTAQPDNKYQLFGEASPLPIKEDSELVFINGFSQSRDTDYYINYERAELTFINKTIPDGTLVEVSFDYFESDTPNKKNVNAYSLESEYIPNEDVEVIQKINIIDPNFLPIGNINYNKGSSKYLNIVNWNMSPEEQVSFVVDKEKISNKKNETLVKKDVYLTNLNINIGDFDTLHKIRYEDISATTNSTEKTKKVISYENKINYAHDKDILYVSNQLSQKNEALTSSKNINTLVLGSKVEYKKDFNFFNLMDSGHITPYYEFNIDKTNSNSSNVYKRKGINSIGFSSISKYQTFLSNTTSFDKSTHTTDFTDDKSYSDNYYNYSHVTNFTPFNWLNSNLNISHEESISPIPGQENKVEDRVGYNLQRIAHDASFQYLNIPSYVIKYFHGSYSNFGYLKTKRRENNALKGYKENRYFGSFNSWRPFEGFLLPKFSFNSYDSLYNNNQKTSSQESNKTTTNFHSYDTSFKYKPNITHLNRLSFDGSIKFSKSLINGNLILTSGTSNITKSTLLSDAQKYGVNILLPNIPIFFTSITSPILRLERKWTIKTDESRTTSSDDLNNSFLLDNSSTSANSFILSYNMLRSFKFKNTGLDETSYYNRNKLSSNQGSLFKNKQMLDQQVNYSILNIFKNTTYAKYEKISQYKNENINISPTQLKTDFDTSLSLLERLASHETKAELWSYLSLVGKVSYQKFNQKVASRNIDTPSSAYEQTTLTSGIILTPLSGLSITYDLSLKQLSSNDLSKVRGYKENMTLAYTPIQYKNFKLQLNLSKRRDWGFGFNSLEKDILLQTTNESLSIDIIPRNDAVILGSLLMNIELPIQNSDHLEKIIFTGEGYIKKITDKLNTSNSYMVNGFLFNLRIEL